MLRYNTDGRCEWCGDPFRSGDDVVTEKKGGNTVLYHESCVENDMAHVDPEVLIGARQEVLLW